VRAESCVSNSIASVPTPPTTASPAFSSGGSRFSGGNGCPRWRNYCETIRAAHLGAFGERLNVPSAGAIFAKEVYKAPRMWAEAAFDLRQWSVFDTGGHFAALEEPTLLVDDIRSFFRTVR
jgi:pimeloyl-ACP methyl ester carboxylesterase